MAYLQTEPVSGTYAGFNPLPDPTLWALDLPGGVGIHANGRVGLLRVVARPSEARIDIDYGIKPDQACDDMADALLVFGIDREPTVAINGMPSSAPPEPVRIDGTSAWRIALPAFPGGASPGKSHRSDIVARGPPWRRG